MNEYSPIIFNTYKEEKWMHILWRGRNGLKIKPGTLSLKVRQLRGEWSHARDSHHGVKHGYTILGGSWSSGENKHGNKQ